MLNQEDFDNIQNLYKTLITCDERNCFKIVEETLMNFSKENAKTRYYIIVIRGMLLDHIITNIGDSRNKTLSEIRKKLKEEKYE